MAAQGLLNINNMKKSDKRIERRRLLTSVVQPKKTLFEKLGGAPSIDAAVDLFYKKVLADRRVNSFFKGTDMKKQHRMQKAFLTFAFGGPGSYSGKNMRKAHQKIVDEQGLNDSHYDVIVELLGGTLKELGVCDADVAEAATIANSVRDDVLCKDPVAEKKTLYEKLGGAPSIDAAVDLFYKKVLADRRVNSFFKGTDMKKQHRMQKAFLTFAFGGPGSYSGKNMRKAHQKLVDEQGLNDSHYDVIVELLGGTLKELGVCDADVTEAATIANSVRDDVLCKDPVAEKKSCDAAVDMFYDKILADEHLNSFFKGTDMKKEYKMQKAFLTFAFGGPGTYSGKNPHVVYLLLFLFLCMTKMAPDQKHTRRESPREIKAHKPVEEQVLNDSHYDVIVELLGGTLKELGACDADVAEAATIANSVRDDVLCKDPVAEKKTLYEKLGGAPSIDAVVDLFYKKVLADRRVNSFFKGTDMKKQHRMQKAFLTFAFGGPGSYSGKNMRKAHQKLVDEQGLNDSHYDVIVELLGGTLKELGVCDADVTEAATIANSVRDDVLCKDPVAEKKTLYEKLGGAPSIDAAVDLFYKKVLADRRVNSFFKGTDMKKQHRMQKAFLTFAFGGPGSYSGKNMRKAHQNLVTVQGLNDSHYDVIVELLGGTLKELGVCDADVTEAATIANSVRDDVLCKDPVAEKKTLYEKLGGAPSIDAAVDMFYKKVLADRRVNSFFKGTDMKKQHRMQKAFLTFAFGGPGSYSGKNMRKAHQKLVDEQGLNDSHYDVIVELLGGTLKELGVCDADVTEAATIANSVRDDVLCKDPVAEKKTLFEKLGGAPSIDAAVDLFYKKVLADRRVNSFFKGTDMKKQHRMQKAFLTFAFGGPGSYSGKNMRKAHQKLVTVQGLNDSHYDVIVELLGGTLKELGVCDADVAEAASIANSVRDDVLCK